MLAGRRRGSERGRDEGVAARIVAAPEIAIVDVLALDEALGELNARDARRCQAVELRFFAGLSIEEVAAALHVSTATVERDWTVARAWLHQRLS